MAIILRTLCLLLAPFTPHLAEEIWQEFFASKGKFKSVHYRVGRIIIPSWWLRRKSTYRFRLMEN